MTDPRTELRSTLARWLQLRAKVRALAHALAASDHGLRRMARASADKAEMTILTTQLHAERAAIDAVARELDERIAHVRRDLTAIEAAFVDTLAADTRARTQHPEIPP